MKKRPYIVNVLASSLDGKIASKPFETDTERRESGFVLEEDKKVLMDILSGCDAVFMGANSLRSTKGALRVPNSKQQPFWVIFSRYAFPCRKNAFWKQQGIRKFTFCIDERIKFLKTREFKSHQSLKCGLDEYLLYLKTQGVRKIALLGGAKLNSLFWSSNYVDELRLTISPRIIGSKRAINMIDLNKNLNQDLKLIEAKTIKDYFYLKYSVPK